MSATPASVARPAVVLVHGAANSASVWTFWREALERRGFAVRAPDLRGHGARADVDLSRTGMADYATDVVAAARGLPRPVLVGWSMGGLVAMMAASALRAVGCVGLAPSTPARRFDPTIALRAGTFGAEVYGITSSDPEAQPMMADLDLEERRIALASLGRESQLARDERQAGIVIESLPCPLLIVTGTADTQWPRERYADLPLAAEHLSADASHWGLVLNRRTLAALIPRVIQWIELTCPA
jgi:pimeloyl-ACP methyl ester carboxylesterase